MQHIDKIEKFFEFLEEHLESGFAKKKREYSLSYYDEYSDETDEIKDEFIYAGTEGRIEYNNGFEVIYNNVIYLNPLKKIKRIYSIKNGSQEEVLNEVSLYKELRSLYARKFREFYNSFIFFHKIETKDFTTNFTKIDELQLIINKINYFKELAGSYVYYVLNKDGIGYLLLNKLLETLENRICSYIGKFNSLQTLTPDKTASILSKQVQLIGEKSLTIYSDIEVPSKLVGKVKGDDLNNFSINIKIEPTDSQKLINKIESTLLNKTDKGSNEVEQKQFNEQKNKFNGMGFDKVKEHFLQLTTSINKNKEPYLTESQLELFLEQVFIKGKTLEANKFDINYSRGAQKEIYRLFYTFYIKSTSSIKFENTLNCKEKYVKLLTDNFSNFDYKKFSNNFNKYQ